METEPENREEVGLINGLLAFLANFGCRHPWIVLAGTVLTCVASLVTSYVGLEFHTQRNDLISPNKPFYQRWQQYVAEFGDDDDMVVVVEGGDRQRMEAVLEDLAQQVEQKPKLFDRLFYKVDLRSLRNRAMLFLPVAQIRQIQDKLQDMWLLLELPLLPGLVGDPLFSWKSLGMQHLMHEGTRRLSTVRLNKGNSSDEDFFNQFSLICRGAGNYLNDPNSYKNPWVSVIPVKNANENYLQEPQYFFCGDGSLATLLVRPMKEKDGFTFAQKSIDGMREILEQTQKRYPDVKLGLTGLPVLENDEMIASQNDSNLASWLALIGVAALYLVVYRGIMYPLMTVVTLLVGTAWALGWMTVTVGHLNILSSAFAVMLIGMGDYGVLWVTRFNQERQDGATLPEAIQVTAVSVGPGILTAALTTALAFYATMLADLKAVAELGWIAGSGVLLCALSCFIVMPALLSLLDSRMRKKKNAELPAILSLAEAQKSNRQWLPSLTHRPRWIIPVSLGLTLILAYFALSVRYDHNLLHMQAPNLESVKWEHKLINKNTGTSWHALSYTTTPEEALALKAKFEQQSAVSQVIEVASLVPRDQERKVEQMRDIQERLRRLPERGKVVPHSLPDIDSLVGTATKLCKDLEGSEEPRLRDLRQSLQFLIAQIQAAGSRAAEDLRQYEQLFTLNLADELHKLRDVSTPKLIQVADLPQSLRERYIGKNGKWLLRVFAKETLWDYEPLEKFVAQVESVDSEACGKPFSTLEGLKAMRNGFFWAGIYAFIAMVIVLLLDFGNCKHMIIALAPLFMGLVATMGLMYLFGISLNPANMIAFPLVLGVGADNGVHVLHDYRSRNRSKRYSLSFATGWGIMVAALTTILGFCTLTISQHRGLYSLGVVLTLGVTCCMLTALVFLPALLRLVSVRHANKQVEPFREDLRKSA